tara:strand:+ start:51 stop:677 length:627 start_codon:yes stop_codon:yes gene_type:complete
MADIVLDVQSAPVTPSAGQANLSFNTTTKLLMTTNDAGLRKSLDFVNFSTASQAPAAATRTYITGSNIAFVAAGLQAGTILRWMFNMTKTGAGLAASTFDIAFGTAGTTADTARVSFTKPAGTAVIDEANVIIFCVIRSIGAAGVAVGKFNMTHNLAATGHALIPCVDVVTVSAGFDMTALTNVGVCITSGAADAITIQLCTAEAMNL